MKNTWKKNKYQTELQLETESSGRVFVNINKQSKDHDAHISIHWMIIRTIAMQYTIHLKFWSFCPLSSLDISGYNLIIVFLFVWFLLSITKVPNTIMWSLIPNSILFVLQDTCSFAWIRHEERLQLGRLSGRNLSVIPPLQVEKRWVESYKKKNPKTKPRAKENPWSWSVHQWHIF